MASGFLLHECVELLEACGAERGLEGAYAALQDLNALLVKLLQLAAHLGDLRPAVGGS